MAKCASTGEASGLVRQEHWTKAHQAEALARALDATPDMGFMSRWLALCSMPRTHPGKRMQFRRVNGPWSLTMTASGEGLPYGNIPRLLLAWVCTEAVRTQSQTVELGDSLAEFMRELGMHDRSGGKRGDRTRLLNQMQRLFRCSVELRFSWEEETELVMSPVAEHMKLCWNVKRPEEPMLWRSELTLGGPFYRELIQYPLPLDMNVLRAMKRSSLGLDLYLWLTYKVYGLSEPVAVSWKQVYRQFAPSQEQGEVSWRTVDGFRQKALRELRKLKIAWPGLNYQLPRGRLLVKPSQTLIVPLRAEALRLRDDDTPHEAMRRHVFRLVSERPELAKDDGELGELLKLGAARAGIPYDGRAVTAAMDAGRAVAASWRGKGGERGKTAE